MWDLVTKIKFGTGWSIPTSIEGILNPKLPFLAVICVPLGQCLGALVKMPKAIMKLIFSILSIPMKIIFVVIKHALKKLGIWGQVSVRAF